jgi:rhodanese-related sulfurtransferase
MHRAAGVSLFSPPPPAPVSIPSRCRTRQRAPLGTAPFALACLVLASWIGGCDAARRTAAASEPAGSNDSREVAASGPVTTPVHVDGAEARALVASGAALLDVRTPDEFRDGHLEGAINIPLSDLAARLSELPRDRPLIVYCASGRRSARAVSALRARGIDARDLGPMRAWY